MKTDYMHFDKEYIKLQTEGKTGVSRLQNHRFLERAILDILMVLPVEKAPLGTKSAHFEVVLHEGTSIPT